METGGDILGCQLALPDGGAKGLVSDTEHGNDISIFWLRDEFSNNADVVQGPLCVRNTHRTEKHINSADLARMVPAILAARKGMQVEVNTNTILASPLNCLEEVASERNVSQVNSLLPRPVTYVHATLGRKGSSPRTSIAQYGSGIRTQLRPAPAICAKSCSVYK